MGKMNDLTGRNFGLLYVVAQAENIKPGRPVWICKCQCGRTITVSSTNLTKANGTKSCGCLRHQASTKVIDLTNQTFGMLTVLHRDTATSSSGKARWVCQCKCGNIKSVLSESLRSGKTKSCGCIVTQKEYDLTGIQFGNLLVIEEVKNQRIRSNETRWKCLCQNCGRTVEVSSYWLRHSNPLSHCKCTRFKG